MSKSFQSPTAKNPRNKSVIGHHLKDKPTAANREEYEVNFNERTISSAMKRRVSAPDSVFNSVMDLPKTTR